MNIKIILGNNIKTYRKKAGLTQEELSEKLDITSKHLSKIEVGQKFVSPDFLEKIYAILKVTPSALFYSPEHDGVDDSSIGIIEKILDENHLELKRKIREEI